MSRSHSWRVPSHHTTCSGPVNRAILATQSRICGWVVGIWVSAGAVTGILSFKER